MTEGELQEEQWELIAPLLPEVPSMGVEISKGGEYPSC